MSHTVIEMNCPGCGARVSTGQSECEWCHKPIIISTFNKWGKDRKWRSSAYQISWIFFSDTQVYVYQYTFNMDEDGKKESTEEYFYKDITNFSTSSDTVEKEVLEKVSCKGEATYTRKNVDSNRFAMVVPGDKFYCSMEQSDYTERAIQGMKAKLREKKG